MALSERKITSWTLPVSSLDDKPKMTAAALKAAFDSNANQLKPAFNALIDDLAGAGGAGNIGAGAINGVSGTTVQAMLEALKALIDLRETTANADSKLNTKADKTTVAAMVKSIGFNAQTGVFTITEQGGTVHTIDTVLEKVPMSCKLEGQDFVLTLEDGTEQRTSLAAFLTPNEFTDSDTVKFSVVGSMVTANIKPGSITMAMLENTLYNQLAALKNDAQTAAANAAASAANAAQHKTDAAASQAAAAVSMSAAEGQAGLAKSWATGETGLRAGENTDNSKYYAEQAAGAAAAAGGQSAAASRSAADAAASVRAAAAWAQNAGSEADRAKSEADRAKQIVGGDYVTETELASAIETVQKSTIPITRITAELPDENTGGQVPQPILDESTGTIKTLLLPDEIGSDDEENFEGPRFIGFRVLHDVNQSTCVDFTGVQVRGDDNTVDVKGPLIRIGGSDEAADVNLLPGIEVNMQTGTTIIRGRCNENDGPCVEINDTGMRFYGTSGSLLLQIEDERIIVSNLGYGIEIDGNLTLNGGILNANGCPIMNVATPENDNETVPKWYVDGFVPKVFTVTIPAINTGVTGSVAGTFPACTASETDCIVDAAPAAASWDAFYDCNFRLKSISPTGFTYTVDSNLTSPMTVYITVQDISDPAAGGGA